MDPAVALVKPMNIPAAKMLISDLQDQVTRANELGATHIQITRLDLVWLLEMAAPHVETTERSRAGTACLDSIVPVGRFDEQRTSSAHQRRSRRSCCLLWR